MVCVCERERERERERGRERERERERCVCGVACAREVCVERAMPTFTLTLTDTAYFHSVLLYQTACITSSHRRYRMYQPMKRKTLQTVDGRLEHRAWSTGPAAQGLRHRACSTGPAAQGLLV